MKIAKAELIFHIVSSTKDNHVITIGDAVGSFLDNRCLTTLNPSLLGLFYEHSSLPSSEPKTGLTNGSSPIAFLVLVPFITSMVTAAVEFGYITYKSGMPLIGSPILVTSAAYHPQEESNDNSVISDHKLQWSAIGGGEYDEFEHCAFSSREVKPSSRDRYTTEHVS